MSKRPEDSLAEMVAGLKAKTGKTLDEWSAIIRKAKLEKHGEMMKLLKGEHSLTHGYANLIALSVIKQSAPQSDADPVD